MKFEYLLFNLVIATTPFIIARFKNTRLPDWRPTFYSISITALIFIIMDFLVTGWWWDFNTRYISGWFIGPLPVEEIMFLLIIPYACLCIWAVMIHRYRPVLYPMERVALIRRIVSAVFIALGLLTGMTGLYYTSIILMMLGTVVYLDELLKTNLLEKKLYYRFIEIVILLTAVLGGYLTWRPIVLYESSVKTNIMVAPIPLENFIYGVSLVMLTTLLYERFRK